MKSKKTTNTSSDETSLDCERGFLEDTPETSWLALERNEYEDRYWDIHSLFQLRYPIRPSEVMFSKLLDILESDVAALPEKDMAIMVMDQFLHKNPEIRNHGLRAIQALYNLGQPQEHLHLEEARKSVVRHFFPAHYRLEGGDVGWCPRRYEGKEELFTVNAESAMSEAQSSLKHILGGGLEPNTYEYCERILERIRHVLLNNDTPKYPHALEECVYQFLDSGDGYIAAAARRACAAITIAYRQLEAEERLWEQLERGETEPYDLEEWIASKRMLNRSAYDLAKKTLELAAQN